ncbi:MAG: hypothetical protein H5T65_13425 [Chloroflexi bacterium]|nr:hypothetical protein [Chloroflexota bacterium]
MPVWVKRALAALIGLVLGLALGGIIGWVVWPVQYYDTDLPDLRAEHQYLYIQMVSEQWELTGDLAQARAAVALLGPKAEQTLAQAVSALEARGDARGALRVLKLMEALKQP